MINKKRILCNKAQCKKCGDIIESRYRHDFQSCGCGAIHVDGGLEYIKRGAYDPDDIIELSEYEILPIKTLILGNDEKKILSVSKHFDASYELVIAKSESNAINMLNAMAFDLVLFVEDFKGVANWLCKNKKNISRITVFSEDYPKPTEARNKLKNAGYEVYEAPFDSEIKLGI